MPRAAAPATLAPALAADLRLADRVGELALAVRNDRVLRQPLPSGRLLSAPRAAEARPTWTYDDGTLQARASQGPALAAGPGISQELELTWTRAGRTGRSAVRHDLDGEELVGGELIDRPDAGAAADVKFTTAGAPLHVSLAPTGGTGTGTALDVAATEAADGSLTVAAPGLVVTYHPDGRRDLSCTAPGFSCHITGSGPDGQGQGVVLDAGTQLGTVTLTGPAGGQIELEGQPAPVPFAWLVAPAPAATPTPGPAAELDKGVGRGIPSGGPWLAFYGSADALAARYGSLEEAARRFRLFVIDADPATANFTAAQVATLKANGANRVLSYLDVGSVEQSRPYWSSVDRAGYQPAQDLTSAQLGPYAGYPNEVWMDPSDPGWRHLLMGYAVPKLVAPAADGGRAVDGLFLDNLELAEHTDAGGADAANGPCSEACRSATYDVVRELRERYPRLLLVANGATGEVSRTLKLGGAPYAAMLDGIVRESAFRQDGGPPQEDPGGREELANWADMAMWAGGSPFWIGTIDYLATCDAATGRAVERDSRAAGFMPFVASTAGHLAALCAW